MASTGTEYAVDVAVNKSGQVAIAYGNEVLDQIRILKVDMSRNKLLAVLPGRSGDREIDLGRVSEKMIGAVAKVREVLFLRSGDNDVLAGGVIAVERV
jgi:hypothetical protein